MRFAMFAPVLGCVLLAACGGESAGEPGDAVSAAPTNDAAAPAPATSAAVSDAEVEFAYRCRSVLTAAMASAGAIPADQVPDEVRAITIRTTSWWTGEAARRDAAAGWTGEQTAAALRGTTRVYTSREALEEVLPVIRQCLEQTPT